jgi:NAD(P)-dependent dehydrogenase (short-subunit alcohol dehydrogenase family)
MKDQSASVALVTGAASGLGRQLALDLADRGSSLVLADWDESGLRETEQLLRERKADCQVIGLRTDITDEKACRFLIEGALDRFQKIDQLFLCAGVSMWARFEEISDLTMFRKLMEVNYLGAVYCIHAALPSLLTSGGSIVAISSLQGEVPIPNHTGYAGAKHALNGFLKSLAFELGDTIHILTVMPGWIRGTNLRANAFTGSGESSHSPRKHSRESVTVGECSALVLQALGRRRRTLFIPRKLEALRWLQWIAPGLTRRLIGRAVKDQR